MATKSLSLLMKPIKFTSPCVYYTANRDWNFESADTVSFAGEGGRLRMSCAMRYTSFQKNKNKRRGCGQYALNVNTDKVGEAILRCINKQWYLLVSYTKDDIPVLESNSVVGIDRGLVNVDYQYNGTTSRFTDGADVKAHQRKWLRTRASLQRKGTKGAKRVLQRISKREKRYNAYKNHCMAKALVANYPCGTQFTLEDLTGISFTKDYGAAGNYALHSWTFYDYEAKLKYKAQLAGDTVVTVSAKYTSQRCPQCGNIDKYARNRELHTYTCAKCNFCANDDLVGAMNIYALGLRFKNGEKHPRFSKEL